MNDNAKQFFHACESGAGWEACSRYVAEGARFFSQSKSLTGVDTVQEYCRQIQAALASTFQGASYELHEMIDDGREKVMFFGTSIVRHVGEGGPVPPTQREARVHFVYILTMDDEGKVCDMVKVFDTDTGRRELGWPPL